MTLHSIEAHVGLEDDVTAALAANLASVDAARWKTAVRIGGPDARARRREYIFYAALRHGGALLALVYIAFAPTGWIEWSGFLFFYVLSVLGMSLGYHRYFTHKAFETSLPMRHALGILAQCGMYGSLKLWCADHRRHHLLTDRPGDAHSPFFDENGRALSGVAGIRHSHLGWVFGEALTNMSLFGQGVVGDPVIEWCHRTRIFWFIVSLFVLPALWGWALGGADAVASTILVAGFLRATLALHAIASVNSFGHRYGYQNYKGLDQSRNNLLLGYITLGEGWHNNHHANPRAASTQVRPFEIDVTGMIITLLERLGLVWNVQRAVKAPDGAAEARSA